MAGEDLGFVTPEMAAAFGRRRRATGDDDQENGLVPSAIREALVQHLSRQTVADAQQGAPSMPVRAPMDAAAVANAPAGTAPGMAGASAPPTAPMTADGRPADPPPQPAPAAASPLAGIVKTPDFNVAPAQQSSSNLAGVQNGMQNIPQNIPGAESGVARMRRLEAEREKMTPRPTDANAVPGAHHGGRKALDLLAGILYGGLTLNPMAGKAIYDQMHGAPLRKAQGEWDSRHDANAEEFDQSKSISTGESSEARAAAAEERAKAAEEKNRNAIDPNSYYQDADGSWKAKTYGGATVDAIPRAAQKPSVSETEAEKRGAREETAKAVGLKPGTPDYQHYVATGTFREATQGRQPTELELWINAFKKEHNREPNADEIVNRKAKTSGTFKDQAGVEKEYKNEYDKQEHEYQRRREDILKRYGADKDPAAYNDNKDAIEGEIRDLDKWNEGEKNKLGERKRGDESALPQHHAAGGAAKSSGAHKVGDQVMYKGKPHTVKAVNPDGTLELEAQ